MKLEYSSTWIPEAYLITAKSFLVDRAVPDCEIVCLPPKKVSGGTFTADIVDASPPLDKKSFFDLLNSKARQFAPQDERLFFDFRVKNPENWSHFLNMHLPIFFVACELLNLNWNDARVIVPYRTPKYIMTAAQLFGIEIQATDAPLVGKKVDFTLTDWALIRADWQGWVNHDKVKEIIRSEMKKVECSPKKVFLARRKTRNISNMEEVEAFLSKRGFTTIYPETLTVAHQFKIFRDAETVVGIHGAGLAPILYSEACPEKTQSLVEILPCGHMSDAYRVMCDKKNWRWIGVRGKLKPSYIKSAYDMRKSIFNDFSLDSFEVDTSSLEIALNMLEK